VNIVILFVLEQNFNLAVILSVVHILAAVSTIVVVDQRNIEVFRSWFHFSFRDIIIADNLVHLDGKGISS